MLIPSSLGMASQFIMKYKTFLIAFIVIVSVVGLWSFVQANPDLVFPKYGDGTTQLNPVSAAWGYKGYGTSTFVNLYITGTCTGCPGSITSYPLVFASSTHWTIGGIPATSSITLSAGNGLSLATTTNSIAYTANLAGGTCSGSDKMISLSATGTILCGSDLQGGGGGGGVASGTPFTAGQVVLVSSTANTIYSAATSSLLLQGIMSANSPISIASNVISLSGQVPYASTTGVQNTISWPIAFASSTHWTIAGIPATSSISLTAGTNVTISTTTNSITINSSGESSEGVATTSPFSAGYITLATSSVSLTNSNIYQLGTYIGIGTTTPNNTIQVNNLVNFNNSLQSTYLGYLSGSQYATTSVNADTAIGYMALASSTASSTVGSFSTRNVAIGTKALAQNTWGAYNVGLGWSALYSNTTGQQNMAIGQGALYYNTTGQQNIAVGTNAINQNTTSSYMTAIGTGVLQNAGQSGLGANYNIGIGYQAAQDLYRGTNNIVIGNNINLPNATTSDSPAVNNTLDIGNLIYATGLTSFTSPTTTVSAGKVGIGTSTPAYDFTIASSTTGVLGAGFNTVSGSSTIYLKSIGGGIIIVQPTSGNCVAWTFSNVLTTSTITCP